MLKVCTKISDIIGNMSGELSFIKIKKLTYPGEMRIYKGKIPNNVKCSVAGKCISIVKSNAKDKKLRFEVFNDSYGWGLKKAHNQTWIGIAHRTGEATFFRYVLQGDSDKFDIDAIRMQGEIGVELELAYISICKNDDLFIDSFTLR